MIGGSITTSNTLMPSVCLSLLSWEVLFRCYLFHRDYDYWQARPLSWSLMLLHTSNKQPAVSMDVLAHNSVYRCPPLISCRTDVNTEREKECSVWSLSEMQRLTHRGGPIRAGSMGSWPWASHSRSITDEMPEIDVSSLANRNIFNFNKNGSAVWRLCRYLIRVHREHQGFSPWS